jgi:thioredoxin 1
MVLPIIEEIAGERDDIVVAKVNVDDEPELAERFGVFSIPALFVLRNGEIVNKSTGAKPKEQILALLG